MMLRTLLALVALLSTGSAQAIDLLELYREVRINDARYAAAQAQYRAMQERIPQARAGLLPKLDVDARAHRSRADVDYNSSRFRPGSP